MRTILGILIMAAALSAQTGTVDVQLSVTARAGSLTCAITPAGGVFTVACSTPTWALEPITIKPEADSADAVTVQVNKGANAITIMLSQAATGGPVAWQVAANGISKSGTF